MILKTAKLCKKISFFLYLQALFTLAKRRCSTQSKNWILRKILAFKKHQNLIVFLELLMRGFRSLVHFFCSALRERVMANPLFPALDKLLAGVSVLVLS